MGSPRKSHSSSFKSKVAIEAIKEEKTISQLSGKYGVHANQIRAWKKKVLEELPGIFSRKRRSEDKKQEELVSELYRQIGQLKVEADWLKKKSEQIC